MSAGQKRLAVLELILGGCVGDSVLTNTTDTELLAALDQHPTAPSVRFHVGGRLVAPSSESPDQVRELAMQRNVNVRTGRGFIAIALWDDVAQRNAVLVARDFRSPL